MMFMSCRCDDDLFNRLVQEGPVKNACLQKTAACYEGIGTKSQCLGEKADKTADDDDDDEDDNEVALTIEEEVTEEVWVEEEPCEDGVKICQELKESEDEDDLVLRSFEDGMRHEASARHESEEDLQEPFSDDDAPSPSEEALRQEAVEEPTNQRIQKR